MINDYRRWLLIEVTDPVGKKKGKGGPKAIGLGMEKLSDLKKFELIKLRREFPLEEDAPSYS